MKNNYNNFIQTKGGLLSPYLAKKRLQQVMPYIKENKQILDYGCDLGSLSDFVDKNFYTGYDINKNALLKANIYFSDKFFTNNKNDLKNNYYDIIFSLAVIEHVKDQERFINELGKYLKNKDSIIVLTTPNPYFRLIHELGAKMQLFSNDASDDHEELIGKETMHRILKETKFKILHHKYFLFSANQLFVICFR